MSSLEVKISITGSTGIPARYGGFETFAENISRQLAKKYAVTVFCSSKFYAKEEQSDRWNGITRRFIPLPANGPFSLLYDFMALLRSKDHDRIILLGAGAGLLLPFVPRRIRAKLWLHIDGVEWKRAKWKLPARLFLRMSYRTGIRFATRIICDNPQIEAMIPRACRSKIVEISYGADHLPEIATPPIIDSPYALTIARAVTENNIEMIIEGFLASSYPKLVVISNWTSSKCGRSLYRKYLGEDRLTLVNAEYDIHILQNYRKYASLYIHCHSAGGSNPSLIEAMHSRLPFFAHDNRFNRSTTHGKALYFDSAESLGRSLSSAMQDVLSRCAGDLHRLAAEHYTWEKVSAVLEQDFEKNSSRG